MEAVEYRQRPHGQFLLVSHRPGTVKKTPVYATGQTVDIWFEL